MIAAIYARKSTEQPGVAEAQKSVTRQKDLARAFAEAQGWTVDPAYVFEDDGISGAEFDRRPGYQRLLPALKPRAPFNVLVVAEQKAIGREAYETQMTIKTLAKAGVEVFEYMHGRSLTPRNAMDKAMGSLQGFGDELHREQSSERVHEGHAQRARKGYCVGGRVFGYRNIDVYAGQDVHGRRAPFARQAGDQRARGRGGPSHFRVVRRRLRTDTNCENAERRRRARPTGATGPPRRVGTLHDPGSAEAAALPRRVGVEQDEKAG